MELNNMILAIIPIEGYMEKKKKILREVFKKNNVVYITINRSFDYVLRQLEKDSIKGKVIFIDAITKTIASDIKKEDVLFVENPQSLTQMAIMIDVAISKIKDGILFFDSLSTLSTYNNPDIIPRFAHSLVNKLEKKKINGVFISVKEETDKKLIAQLTQFVDKVVEV